MKSNIKLPDNIADRGEKQDIIDMIFLSNCISKCEFSKLVAKRIKEIRLSQNMSIRQLTHMANLSPNYLWYIEKGQRILSIMMLVRICNALGVTVDYVLQDVYAYPEDVIEEEIMKELHLSSKDTKKKILDIIKILNK